MVGPSLGPCPSLHQLRSGWHRLVRRLDRGPQLRPGPGQQRPHLPRNGQGAQRIASGDGGHGPVTPARTDLADFKKPFAHEHAPLSSFVEAVEAIRPTGIIGVSTVPKQFNRAVIEAMARVNERPIIFPYSNPTSRSECTAEEAYKWSGGRAIFASGSPFPPVQIGGRSFVPGQGNNVYIFPAMGMAILATEATRVTEEMFIVAAKAVA